MGRSFKRPSRAPASRSAHACAAADGSGGGSSPAGGGGSSSTGCWPSWAAQGSGATAPADNPPAALPQAVRRRRAGASGGAAGGASGVHHVGSGNQVDVYTPFEVLETSPSSGLSNSVGGYDSQWFARAECSLVVIDAYAV